MCTAITYKTKDFYFGRNLDHMESYGEEVVITPRNYPFRFRKEGEMDCHYAMIGTACVREDQALYYDAVNETGLCMAGLNFVGNAVYRPQQAHMKNVAQFELIPWILGQCASVDEARGVLRQTNLLDISFDGNTPPAELHWIIADRSRCVVLEVTAEGADIYENPACVLTNNPPFPAQMLGLNNYMHLSAGDPVNKFAPDLPLTAYSRGMGAIGLPGDLSSQSRFVRAAFAVKNSVSGESEEESVGQFFHILDSVKFIRGCCDLGGDIYDITLYSSCCNADKGVYYYTTYENRSITAVDMYGEDLSGREIVRFPMRQKQQITAVNLR